MEDDDIYGDGVNVAARLEALAEPGEICVSRTVYNHAKSKVAFGFEPMGEHRVKNIPEPVTVYRVITEPGPLAKVLGLQRAGTRRWRVVRRWRQRRSCSWWPPSAPGCGCARSTAHRPHCSKSQRP